MFVVTYFNSGDDQEVNEAVAVAIVVTMAVLALTSVLAWVVAGRVLAPLRLLTETAHLISESDLTRRIPVQGIDEICELTKKNIENKVFLFTRWVCPEPRHGLSPQNMKVFS